MPRTRRAAALFVALAAAVGCSKSANPSPEATAAPAPPPPAADAASQDQASSVRTAPGQAPPPADTQAKPPAPPPPGPWPELGAYPDPGHRPVHVPNVTGSVTGVVVSAAAGRAAVFEALTGRSATRVVLCDTAAGAIASEWEMRDALVPLDLSPDGRQIAARPANAPGSLVLLTVGDDLRLRRKTWTPHGPPESGDVLLAGTGPDRTAHVNWAGFVSDVRLVSVSAAGQLRVFDTTTGERVGTFEGVIARPTVCPDGARLLALTVTGLAVLDPAAGRLVSSRPFDPIPGEKALALSPDGRTVACYSPGRLALLDLTTGERRDAHISALGSGAERPAFGWAGPNHLVCGPYLFDPAFSVPVWRYDGAAATAAVGPKVWAVTRPTEKKVSTLTAYTLPHPGVAEATKAALAKPGAFVLRAGEDAVRVDVSALPADRQAEAREAVEKGLARSGYKVDPAAAVAVVASEDATGSPTGTRYIGVTQAEFTKKPARLKVVKDGKTVWEQAWAVEPETPLWLPKAGSLNTYLAGSGIGGPDRGLFRRVVVPAAVPGPSAPRVGFGLSTLTPTGPKPVGEKAAGE
jgi:hypothetical protein